MNKPKAEHHVPWYVAAFGAAYLDVYAHRDDADAAAAVSCCIEVLGLDPKSRLLDLCCGAGRHLAHFHRAGFRFLAGLDLSEPLLKRAAECVNEAVLVQGDARVLPFRSESFSVLVNLFSSFGYFPTDAEDLRMLKEAARVLEPRGKALFDLMNPAWVRAHLIAESRDERDGLVILAHRAIDALSRRVEKRVTISGNKGSPLGYTESVRLYAPAEFDRLAEAAGFRVVARLGAFDSRPYKEETSERQIVILRRT